VCDRVTIVFSLTLTPCVWCSLIKRRTKAAAFCSRQYVQSALLSNVLAWRLQPVIHVSSRPNCWSCMREVDGVKAYTASDPLDVSPTCMRLHWGLCGDVQKPKPKKKRNRVLEIENRTESNRILKIQTDPALVPILTYNVPKLDVLKNMYRKCTRWTKKKIPPTTFVDITAMHGNFCTKFYTIVKRSNIHFITKFDWNISGIDKATQF